MSRTELVANVAFALARIDANREPTLLDVAEMVDDGWRSAVFARTVHNFRRFHRDVLAQYRLDAAMLRRSS